MDDEQRYDPMRYHREAATAEAPDKAALLPDLNTTYKASGIVDNAVPRLVVIAGRDGFRIGSTAYVALQYAHIGTGEFGFTADGHVFRYPFFDLQPKLLTVHGRNLLRIFDNIALHRLPWIRQKDRDFRVVGDQADEPVITRAEVSDWKREPQEQAKALAEAMEVETA